MATERLTVGLIVLQPLEIARVFFGSHGRAPKNYRFPKGQMAMGGLKVRNRSQTRHVRHRSAAGERNNATRRESRARITRGRTGPSTPQDFQRLALAAPERPRSPRMR